MTNIVLKATPGPMRIGAKVRLTDPLGESMEFFPVVRENTPTKVGGFAYIPIVEGAEEECRANAEAAASATDYQLLLKAVVLGVARIEKWAGTWTGEVIVSGLRHTVRMPGGVPVIDRDELREGLMEAIEGCQVTQGRSEGA